MIGCYYCTSCHVEHRNSDDCLSYNYDRDYQHNYSLKPEVKEIAVYIPSNIEIGNEVKVYLTSSRTNITLKRMK